MHLGYRSCNGSKNKIKPVQTDSNTGFYFGLIASLMVFIRENEDNIVKIFE